MNTIRGWSLALRRRAARYGESGQALAEVAIALPLLLLMLVGIWEFARAYQVQQVIVNAAREGAREVVLPNDPPDGTVAKATTVTENYLASGNVPCDGCVTITGNDNVTGDPMTVAVSVDYRFNFLGPLIRLVTGDSGGPGDITLESSATMRHE